MTGTSKEYAIALFELGREDGTEKEIFDGLVFLSEVFAATPEYVDFLASPGIPMHERLAAFSEAFKEKVPEKVFSFTALLCEHGRIRIFSSCAEEYSRLYRDWSRISLAHVVSAIPLTEEECARLRSRLEERCGHKVQLICETDPALLGGMVVDMDGVCMDGSLRRRLGDLKDVMRNE